MNWRCIIVWLALPFVTSVWSQTNYTPYSFITLAGSTNAGAVDGVGTAAKFGVMRDVAVDGTGNVYVADTANNIIRRVTPDGVVTTIAGLAGQAGTNDGVGAQARFNGPQGIAVDRTGAVYVADITGKIIRRLTATVPSGQTNWMVTTIAGLGNTPGSQDGTNGQARFFGPRGLAVDAAGNLYVTEFSNDDVRKIAPQGANWVVTTLAGLALDPGSADGTNTAARFNAPTGIAVDAATNLYLADLGNNSIRKISPVGTDWVVTTIAGRTNAGFADGLGTNALFNQPNGIALGIDGDLYVPEHSNDTIRRLTPSGSNWLVTTLAGVPQTGGSSNGTGGGATFNGPVGVAVDTAGNVYIGDINNHSIRKGWAAGTVPVCILQKLVLINSQAKFDVTIITGSVTNLVCLEANQLGSGWVTNTGASIVSNIEDVSYEVTAPLQSGPLGFYRIQLQ